MISNTIYRNVSSFYGSYSLVGSISGVLGSQLVRILIEKYNFPANYRYLFLFGLIMAVIATFVVVFGVKEIPTENRKKIRYSDLPAIAKDILVNNHQFRNILIVRIFIAAAEMTVPFYIIKVSMIEGVSLGFVGVMSTTLLLSNLVFSKLIGTLGDKKGPYFLIQIGCLSGLAANLLSVFIKIPILAFPLFALVSVATLSASLSNSVSVIVYSTKGLVPIYAAISGLLIAPFYAIFSLGGGVIAERFNYSNLFIASSIIYAFGFFLSKRFDKKQVG